MRKFFPGLQRDELIATEPDEGYEDPADVVAINEPKENMGDYKLKTADDYVVPDHLRMNVEKVRSRLLLIKDLVRFLRLVIRSYVHFCGELFFCA